MSAFFLCLRDVCSLCVALLSLSCGVGLQRLPLARVQLTIRIADRYWRGERGISALTVCSALLASAAAPLDSLLAPFAGVERCKAMTGARGR